MATLTDAVEIHARWAALVAYVEDIHQPQDNLTEDHWAAAERAFGDLSNRHHLAGDDLILFNALGTMLDHFDPPDMPEEGWKAATALLARYTAAVDEGRAVE